MQIVALILTLLQFAIKVFDLWREKDKEKAQAKKELLHDGLEAIKESDISSLNATIDKLNRL